MAIAAGLASQGSQTGLILACLFYQLGYLMDCVDGEVARLTNRCSRTGKTLDTILDGMNIILLSGFAFGVSCYSRGFLTIGWFYFVIFAGLISFAVPRILHLLSQRQSKMSSHNNDSAITTKLRHASILFDLPAFIFSPSGFYTYTLIVLLSPFGNVIPIILKVYAVGLIAKTVLRIIVFGLRSNIQKALDTKIPDTLNPEHQPFGQAKNIGA
jgi:phosphatidylglycerophosphate synthase